MDMSNNNTMAAEDTNGVMMHMSLYWGRNVWVLFSDWPGTSLGQYILSLIVTFLAALLVELLAFSNINCSGLAPVANGFLQAVVYGVRVLLAYCVMLAVMSFNLGVLIVAVVAHAVGYWLFATQAFKKSAVEPTAKDGGMCCA